MTTRDISAEQTKGQKIVDEFPIQVTDHPAEADWQWLEDSINRFNMHLLLFVMS